METEMQKFRDAVAPYAADWNAVDVRVVALRGQGGPWVLYALRAVLVHAEAASWHREPLPDVPGLLVLHERLPSNELQALLDGSEKGVLTLAGHTIELTDRTMLVINRPNFYVQRLARGDHRSRGEGVDSANIVLGTFVPGTAQVDYNETMRIAAALREATPPYKDLDDLRQSFVGFGPQFMGTPQGLFEVNAPLGARLEHVEIDGQRLTAHIALHAGARPDRVALSVIGHLSEGRTQRLRIPVQAAKDGKLMAEVTLAPEASRAEVFLNYGGAAVDSAEVYGRVLPSKNARVAALQHAAGSLEDFRERLLNARDRALEQCAALLFHVLRFSPGYYGFTSWPPWEPTDIVAFPDGAQGWCVAVECTAREPDIKDKLMKLASRTKELERITSGKVVPVLLTALERSVVPKTNLDTAATERIAVVTATDIPALLQLAVQGAQPAETRRFLEQRVPPKQA